jgi:hypothetical protein
MPTKQPKLKTGHIYPFVCLQIDIAGHSKVTDAERILHAAKERFHDQIKGTVASYRGQPFKWEGDGGAFLFSVTDGREFDEAVFAALRLLESLPSSNEEIRLTTGLRKGLSVRISVDSGQAVYNATPGLITADFLNAFLKNERTISQTGAVTITERVHRQLSEPLRVRFVEWKLSEELACRIYRSIGTLSTSASAASYTSQETNPSTRDATHAAPGPDLTAPPRSSSTMGRSETRAATAPAAAGQPRGRVRDRAQGSDTQTNKVKVLFLAANPTGTPALQLDEEIREITAKIRASDYRVSIELISRWAVRPDDLLQALLENKPHIVHFSGHGGSDTEELVLHDQSGRPKPVSKAALYSLFRTLKDNVRVVLLNACSTRPQAEALSEIIDCVVGMNRPIGDAAAIVFAASFYRAIGFGRSVQEAFDLGKVALHLEGVAEDRTPELFVHKGLDASALSLIAPPSTSGEVVILRERVRQSTTKPLLTLDRLTFVKTLAGLSPSDFQFLLITIPDAARHVSRQGTIPEQVAELIRWAEGSTGPGIGAVQQAFRTNVSRSTTDPADAKSEPTPVVMDEGSQLRSALSIIRNHTQFLWRGLKELSPSHEAVSEEIKQTTLDKVEGQLQLLQQLGHLRYETRDDHFTSANERVIRIRLHSISQQLRNLIKLQALR